MLARIANVCFTHRRRVILAWLALILVTIGAGSAFAGTWTNNGRLPGTDSQAAYDLLQHRFPAQAGESDSAVFTGLAAHRTAIERWLAQLGHQHGVIAVGPLLAAPRADIATASFVLAADNDDHPASVAHAIQQRAAPLHRVGVKVAFSGDSFETGSVPSSEVIGIAAALVILLVVLGSVLAAGLPIVLALVGLGVAIPAIALVAHVVPTPDFTSQVAAMIGIGVGIDYTLLVVTRFRSALARSCPKGTVTDTDVRAATLEAVATAGRSVVLAGSIVVVSLSGLLLMRLNTYDGLAVGCAVAVAVAVAATLTLLPALLSLAGRRIGRARRAAQPQANRLVALVQRRPAGLATGGLLVLLLLAGPALGMHLGTADAGTDPAGSTTHQAYELTRQGFGPGAVAPLTVVADTTHASKAALGDLRAALADQAGVASVSAATIDPHGDAAVLTVIPTTGPAAGATSDLVTRIRTQVVAPVDASTGLVTHVGGETASNVDFATTTSHRLPGFVGGVLIISFLLLLAGFRAPLVALQAVVVNLLSVGAAYGLLVAVFQWGWGAGLIGATPAPLAPWIPTMLFAITFGLSMDYEVFLVGAINDARARVGDGPQAVAQGLAGTARIITAAAAIMAVVFGSFVTANDLDTKVIGLGLAAAIVVDATVIRMLVVPAMLTLLGPAAWWTPRGRTRRPAQPRQLVGTNR